MPIDLFTGQPGNGKTVQMIQRLLAEAKKAERPLFACGIDGLQPGLATVLHDARHWNDKDADGAYIVPDGSLVFVDEAWKWFGHLHDAGRQGTPPHVLALAEHRHRGLDFVWTAQQPNQLYPFVRGLIGSHTHVVRRYGTQFVDLYLWGELQEDVKSAGKRELAQKKTVTLDKSTFDQFKSAEVHTIKRRLPLKVLAFPAIIVAALVIAYVGYQKIKPDAITARLAGSEGQPAQAGGPASTGTNGKAPVQVQGFRTAAEYIERFTPMIPAIPWTAPAFASREVQSDPVVVCMASDAGETADGYRRGSCTCMTEQGTQYAMPDAQCRYIARRGTVYNPFKAPQRDKDSRLASTGAGQGPAETALPFGSVGGAAGTGSEPPAYGAMANIPY